jgi:hypothetical protein
MENTVAERLLQIVREIVAHEIDIVTESEWFEQYIEREWNVGTLCYTY